MNNVHENITQIISDLSQGKMCIVVDDKDRENEGDIIACASTVTPEQINFMAKFGRGLICLAMSDDDINRLALPPMVDDNQCPHSTAFTLSIDAKENITTGISAFDRAHTIRLAANPSSTLADFRMPGHVFPLRAKKGGIQERAGHTEASIELVKLATGTQSAAICEIMDDAGHMMRLPALAEFAKTRNLLICTIAELKSYLLSLEQKVA